MEAQAPWGDRRQHLDHLAALGVRARKGRDAARAAPILEKEMKEHLWMILRLF